MIPSDNSNARKNSTQQLMLEPQSNSDALAIIATPNSIKTMNTTKTKRKIQTKGAAHNRQTLILHMQSEAKAKEST